MTEIYRGFRIERNDYGRAQNGDTWMWSPEEEDGTPYRFEADPYLCRAPSTSTWTNRTCWQT